ncbi:MAG TPA: GNAT family N-acetyltransferase [Bryobacteraceae bacterium]|nr:GNAT family N-acetyltransferase [Bryobacteraceae bacterium]
MVLFEAMEENLRATMAGFGRANRLGETRQLPGVAVTSSEVQFAMFNSALLTSPVANARELNTRVKQAAEFFRARRMPWSFWLCRDWIAQEARGRIASVFDYNRLRLVVEFPGMMAEELRPPSRPLPALAIRRVSEPTTRKDFSLIMSAAFGLPRPVARAIYESECTWSGGFAGYVGYALDMPVCSAATLVTPGATGLYAVGTLPGHRNRGCAEAVMRHALAQAHANGNGGCLVLQSSEAGYALYLKLGYRPETRYAVFST